MLTLFNFFSNLIKRFAYLPPSWVLGILFGAAALMFFTGLIFNIFFKRIKLFTKNFYFYFTNFVALTVFIYCLSEAFYIGENFTLLSSLLTVSIFYLFSQLKYLIIPVQKHKPKSIKKIIENSLKPYTNSAFSKKPAFTPAEPVSAENFKSYQEFDSILKKLKQNQAEEKLALQNGLKKKINISAIKTFTDKLKTKQLSAPDMSVVSDLEKYSYSLNGKDELSYGETLSLNDSLLALLKMMSKYNL